MLRLVNCNVKDQPLQGGLFFHIGKGAGALRRKPPMLNTSEYGGFRGAERPRHHIGSCLL